MWFGGNVFKKIISALLVLIICALNAASAHREDLSLVDSKAPASEVSFEDRLSPSWDSQEGLRGFARIHANESDEDPLSTSSQSLGHHHCHMGHCQFVAAVLSASSGLEEVAPFLNLSGLSFPDVFLSGPLRPPRSG